MSKKSLSEALQANCMYTAYAIEVEGELDGQELILVLALQGGFTGLCDRLDKPVLMKKPGEGRDLEQQECGFFPKEVQAYCLSGNEEIQVLEVRTGTADSVFKSSSCACAEMSVPQSIVSDTKADKQQNRCYARALPDRGHGGQAWGPTRSFAEHSALVNCRRYATQTGGNPNSCRIVESHC